MEAFFSAIIGELASRSFFFLIDKYSKKLLAPSKEESLRSLQRALIRVRVTVEEAEGRHITNHAMLQQLNVLREEMYRGYYVLDNFRCQAQEGDEVSYSSLSKLSSSKRVRSSPCRRHGKDELEQMIQGVEITMTGMNEFVIFLKNHSPICRQPYSKHMFMEKCMFGRQTEMEQVINFLLNKELACADNLSVLPIIGPAKIGKTTLVEHVCSDERVRNHFSCIIFFSENDLREERTCTLRDGGVIKHQHSPSNEEKLLVVIELAGDVNEGAWRKLYSASQSCFSPGSKIIITSRSDKVTKFGTTQPLRLKFLSREAYWYFFKVLAFGSSDPEDHPKLASIAMEIFDEYFDQEKFQEFTGPFIDTSSMAYYLRASDDPRHWRRVLECFRQKDQKNQLLLSRDPSDLGVKRKYVLFQRPGSSICCEIYNQDRVGPAHEQASAVTMGDILSGSVRPHGKFEVVVWKSPLPPYYSYIYSCEIHELNVCIMHGQKRRVLS